MKVSKSGAMWSKVDGSRQAHYEKVAQGRRNEALLANRAAVEDITHQIARNRQRQAGATSVNALIVTLTTCQLGEASFVEVEEFLRCYSKTEKQIVSERTPPRKSCRPCPWSPTTWEPSS